MLCVVAETNFACPEVKSIAMTANHSPQSIQIEILVGGHLDARRSLWFEGLTLTRLEDGTTRLSGSLPDQAALFALLSRIRDLGLPLLSVRRFE